MGLKTAAFLARIGMLLLTVVYRPPLVNDLAAFSQNAIAAVTILTAAIHLFASLTVTIFFFVFYRAQA